MRGVVVASVEAETLTCRGEGCRATLGTRYPSGRYVFEMPTEYPCEGDGRVVVTCSICGKSARFRLRLKPARDLMVLKGYES